MIRKTFSGLLAGLFWQRDAGLHFPCVTRMPVAVPAEHSRVGAAPAWCALGSFSFKLPLTPLSFFFLDW